MCGNIICLAAVLLGVDARWPQLPDGSVQYVIQIEPQALERLESGAIDKVGSHVPPYLNDVRAYQIVMGTQRLAKNVPTPNVHSPIRAGVDTDWVLLPAGGVEWRVWIHPEALNELEKPGRVIEGNIPADVKTPSVFTITVGTKPPAMGSPTTNEANPSGFVEAKTDKLAADLLSASPITPPLPPATVPRPSHSLYTPETQTVPEAAPPDMPSDPDVFKPDAGSARMPVQTANHPEQSGTAPDDRSQANADSSSAAKMESSAEDLPKPWPTTVTLFGLLASLGANVFLLWIMHDSRSRYRALLGRMQDIGSVVRSCVRELESAD